MFHPMALTVALALTAALVLSVTFVPAAVAIFVRGKVAEHDNVVMRGARRIYEPLLRAALRLRAVAAAAAVLFVAARRLARGADGQRVHPEPGRRRHRSARASHSRHRHPTGHRYADAARGAARAVSRGRQGVREARHGRHRDGPDAAVGRRHVRDAQGARSMAGSAQAEGRARRASSRKRLRSMPGNNYEFTQPIEMRFNELISGVRSDVARESLR